MPRFSNRQLLRAHRFVLELHAARNMEGLRALIPRGLSELISCDRASINERAPEQLVPSPVPSWWKTLGPVYERFLLDHPVWKSHRPLHQLVGFDDREVCGRWKKSQLFQEYFVPLGIKHQLSSLIYKQGLACIGIAVNRGRDEYDGCDRGIFELLSPHIGGAWQNALTLESLQQQQPQQRENIPARTSSRASVISLEPETRVIRDLSEDAAKMLKTCFSRDSEADGRLPTALDEWLASQLARLSDSAEFTDEVLVPWCRQGVSGNLTVRVVQRSTADVIVLLRHHATGEPVAPPLKQGSAPTSLTKREQEILHWLREGKRNAEIAVILSISARTVGKHLEHLFEKLGVDNRTAAVRIAAEIS